MADGRYAQSGFAKNANHKGTNMDKIISKDGTTISYQRSGNGTPLVLVHGTGGSSKRWDSILPELAKQFTVYAIDRRGRGESGDTDSYNIEREFEDVAAVVDSMNEPVYLLGHSYGGICALEAARLTRNIARLVLYEPPLPMAGKPIYPEGTIQRLELLLDAGDREGVITTFVREIVRMPAHEFERYRSSPVWAARVAAAHTLPRELRAHEAYQFNAERFKSINIPVLLLVGSDSPDFFQSSIERIHAALPNSRIVVLPGQQHIAMDTAPEMFVREVLTFLLEPS
jgi:pimeloyl-ACP methyl ester carboxylesterase